MFFSNINYLAVLVAMFASMALGFVWYSQGVFGRRMLKEQGKTDADIAAASQKKMTFTDMLSSFGVSAALAFVTAFVFAAFFNSTIVVGIWNIIFVAILFWLAFALPIGITNMVYGKRDSFMLCAINCGYYLVAAILSALIVGIFG